MRPPRPVWPIGIAAWAGVAVGLVVFSAAIGTVLGVVAWTLHAALALAYFLPASIREYRQRCDAARRPIWGAAELAAAYGVKWPDDACPCCGAKLVDGFCTGAGKCASGRCRRQGPVAVQRPGSGAN